VLREGELYDGVLREGELFDGELCEGSLPLREGDE